MYQLKKLSAIINQIAVSTSKQTAFSELLDYALLPFEYFETAEELRAAHEKLQSYKHRQQLSTFLTELAELNPEGFGDPLGEFYMQEISHGHLGQFYTPEYVASLMALSVGTRPLNDGERVLDPACGSGRMLLAMGRYNRHLRFYGADLDKVCCKMALLNLLLNSLSGEIAHMNSISNEFYEGYKITTLLKGGYHYPYFIRFQEKEKSEIWIHPATHKNEDEANQKGASKIHVIQGDLFKGLL
ncbi:N-6 DNA methylase [Compostibacter hankyongensis]|uniref:site-specific DNA-methyltransferase (adenine-specific) n=1 Tax=Compostibacter hankyongensis TaxID=1007089 RepID=A0ABP8G6H9_9BACT